MWFLSVLGYTSTLIIAYSNLLTYLNCFLIFFFSNLTSDFSVKYGEMFTIQIVQWPESIKLQIFETKLLISSLIAEVFIPIPEFEKTTKSSVGTDQYQFTSNKVCTFSHSAVGSGLFS